MYFFSNKKVFLTKIYYLYSIIFEIEKVFNLLN